MPPILADDDWSFAALVLLGLLVGAYLLWHLVKWRRREQRIRELAAAMGPPKCQKCGYDLRASPDYCPECGTRVGDLEGMIIRYMMRLERRNRSGK